MSSDEIFELIKKYKYNGKKEFEIAAFDTSDRGSFESREEAAEEFVDNLRMINKLQQRLYSERKEGVIFVFQAMDAAGKDGVIRTVFSTLSPHGVKEFCFKVPSSEEKSHDYLWRFWSALPAKGNISIFNRSYYEDVLVGKVHKLYEDMDVPERLEGVDVISQRYQQIKDFESYLYDTGTRVVKIFLNVSKDEQARRFISRLDTPSKNWKVSEGDIAEREYWDDYMEAFESMVNATSWKNSPWYVVPSDHKWYSRLIVSRIVLATLKDMNPQYPVLDLEASGDGKFDQIRQELVDSISDGRIDPSQAGEEFSKTENYASDIILDEESKKVEEKRQEVRDSGFKAVREMLAKGYILKSTDEIMDAVNGEEETADEKEYSIQQAVADKFGLTPELKISKKDRKLLRALAEIEESVDFYLLCDYLDERPSDMDAKLLRLMDRGLITTDPDTEEIFLSDLGLKYAYMNKSAKKSEKKFKKFLDYLTDEELAEFSALCDSFEYQLDADEDKKE